MQETLSISVTNSENKNIKKILVTILTHHTSQPKADACLDTWVKDIPPPHDYFFFGSSEQSESMNKFWDCSPDEGEHRLRLPEKTFKMLKKSLEYEWDFLYKCDDDTYLNFKNLEKLVEKNKSSSHFFTGKPCYPILRNSARAQKFKNMAEINKIKLPENFFNEFAWPQGGAGYVISRELVKTITSPEYERLFKFDFKGDSVKPYLVSEDFIVGLTVYLSGTVITFGNNDLFINPNKYFWDPAFKAKERIDVTLLENKFISIHHCKPEVLKDIHQKRSH